MKRLTAICTLTFAGVCDAQMQTGNDLHRWFTSSDEIMATAYIIGVADTDPAATKCVPGEVSNGQLKDVVRKYLADAPAERHKPAPGLVLVALSRAWPCKKP